MKFLKCCFGLWIIVCLFASCSTSRQGKTANKNIDGNWVLQTINMEGINTKFNAPIFNEVDLNCFVGSSWTLSGDSSGFYNLVGGSQGCQTLQRSIHWNINSAAGAPKEFQFKRMDENKKNMDDENGFRLNVTLLDKNTMQLKSAITFEGKPGNIVYNFVKK